jgi:hypothetical protein
MWPGPDINDTMKEKLPDESVRTDEVQSTSSPLPTEFGQRISPTDK